MTNTSFTGQLKQAIDHALPDLDILKTEQFSDFVTKATGIGKALGVDKDPSTMTIGELRALAPVYKEAVDALDDVLMAAFPENSTREELAQQLASKTEVLEKLDAAFELAVAESVLTLARYQKHLDGTVEVTLPRGMTVLELAVRANAECAALGIRPAFDERQSEWWAANESDTRYCTESGKTYRFNIPENSLSKSRSEQERDRDPLPPAGAVMMAEVCERIVRENSGACLFRVNAGAVGVRTSAPSVVLCSDWDGVEVQYRFDDLSSYLIACAASAPSREGMGR